MFQLSPAALDFVKKELGRYETKRSAILPCLYKVQEENGGFVTEESIEYLAKVMDLPVVHIEEVFSFYTMYNKKSVGKYHVQVCCNISCCLYDARELLAALAQEYKVKLNQVTADGKFSFSQVECLGSCGTAPMMQINDDYFENLTVDSAKKILKELK